HPRLHRLLDQPDLLGGWPAATALNRGNHFNAGRSVILIGGHSRNHRRMPMPYRATLPVRSKRGAVHLMPSEALFGAALVALPKGSPPARTVVGAAFGSDAVNAQTAPIQAHVVE